MKFDGKGTVVDQGLRMFKQLFKIGMCLCDRLEKYIKIFNQYMFLT